MNYILRKLITVLVVSDSDEYEYSINPIPFEYGLWTLGTADSNGIVPHRNVNLNDFFS